MYTNHNNPTGVSPSSDPHSQPGFQPLCHQQPNCPPPQYGGQPPYPQPPNGQAPYPPIVPQPSDGLPATCPYCGGQWTVKYAGLNQTGLILFIALLLIFFPICWLPFVMNGMKKKVCMRCQRQIQ